MGRIGAGVVRLERLLWGLACALDPAEEATEGRCGRSAGSERRGGSFWCC